MLYDAKTLFLLLLWAVLCAFVDSSETQRPPWETDINLPHDVIPKYYSVSIQPLFDRRRYLGNVSIDITVTAEKNFIWFTNAGHVVSKLRFFTSSMQRIPVKSIFYSGKNSFIVFELYNATTPGDYQLQLQYDGVIFRNGYPENFYAFYLQGNVSRPIGFRSYATPCFCDRTFRVVYQVQIIHPNNDYQVLSNTKPESVIPDSPTTGMTTTVFKKSPLIDRAASFMGLYMDHVPTRYTSQGIAVTVYSRPEVARYVDRNLEAIIYAFSYYTDFFNFSIPMDKFDVIIVPPIIDFHEADAATQWGITTFRELTGTYQRGITGGLYELYAVLSAVHEPCHMWLPWIVGAKWNSDFFLVESPVVYLESKVVSDLYPDWDVLEFSVFVTYHVGLDDEESLTQNTLVPLEPSNNVSRSDYWNVYYKGAALFRMLECVIGFSKLKRGFRDYVAKYAYKSSTVDNLWKSIQLFVPNFNVSRMMDSWTLQNTFPLLTVTRNNNKLIVTQSRFLKNKNVTYDSSESPFKYLWDVPFDAKGANGFLIKDTQWLTVEKPTVEIEIPADLTWIKLNTQQCGFYRVNYDLKMWEQLAILLQQNMTALDALDRGNLVDDSLALAASGDIPYETALEMTKYLGQEYHLLALYSVLNIHLWKFENIFRDTAGYEYYRAYFAKLLSPHLNRSSWVLSPDVSPLERLVQHLLLERSCHFQLAFCLERAKMVFDNWLLRCGPKPRPEIRQMVYTYGMQNSGTDQFYKMYDQYSAETDMAEQALIRQALCQVRTPSLIRYWLYTAPDDDFVNVLDDCTDNPVAVPILWAFLQENLDYFTTTLRDNFVRVMNIITNTFVSDVTLQQVTAFLEKIPVDILGPDDRASIVNAIKERIALREKYYVPLKTWFENAVDTI